MRTFDELQIAEYHAMNHMDHTINGDLGETGSKLQKLFDGPAESFFLESSSILLAVVNTDGELQEWNEALAVLFGGLRVGQGMTDLLVPGSRERFLDLLLETSRGGVAGPIAIHFAQDPSLLPASYRCQLETLDDGLFLIYAEPIPDLGPQEAKEYLQLTNELSSKTRELQRTKQILELRSAQLQAANENLQREMSSRIEAEREATRRSGELEAIFSAQPDLYFRLNSEGFILECRTGSQDTLGAPSACKPGQYIQQVVDRNLAAKFDRVIRHVQEERSLSTFEYSLQLGNEERWFEARTLPLFDSEMIVLVRDISERKVAEIELSHAHEIAFAEARKLRSLIEGMDEGIIFADSEDTVTEVNSWLLNNLSLSRPDVVGMNLWEILPNLRLSRELWAKVRGFKNKAWSDALAINGEYLGKQAYVRIQPIFDATRYKGLIVNIIDVTDLVEAREQAEEASRSKSRFLANMSHEIRTPIHGIMGLTELALNTGLSSEQREYLDFVKESTDSLLAIINDILDFSKIEAGKLKLIPEKFSLRRCVENTISTLITSARDKGLELVCRVAMNAPDSLNGDPGRFRQVLTNLIGNAIKFTDSGTVEVEIELASSTESEVMLHCTVKDTGIGIPADKQDKIFKVFEQVSGDSSKAYGGTGLGLAVSYQLVELMGGRIWVESERGKGSTFYLRIPFGIEPDARVDSIADPSADFAGVSVLVVDDNVASRKAVEEPLRHWRMNPTAVDGGPAALSVLRESFEKHTPFSILILDATMPGMDGMELLRAVNEDVRIDLPQTLVLTSSSEPEARHLWVGLGARSFIPKPVRLSDLFNAVSEILGEDVPVRKTNDVKTKQTIPKSRRPLHILLAEDNPVNRKLASKMLEKMGHAVAVAEDGLEVLAKLKNTEFDLILMDVQMPNMDGFEATRAIRVEEKETDQHVPIIAMTANALQGDRERCLKAGMDGYIAKPISGRELYETIEGHHQGTDVNRTALLHETSVHNDTILDKAALLDTVKGDEKLVNELISGFLEECPRQLESIGRAIEAGDPKGVREAAHSLKGLLGQFSAFRAFRVAGRLERLGRLGVLTQAPDALEDLNRALSEVENELATINK